jgi:hypothetical protein
MSHTDHARPSRDTTHQCPGRDCTRRVPRHQLACWRHWSKVSRPTQRLVYAAYRNGDLEANAVAMRDAIEEMNAQPTEQEQR